MIKAISIENPHVWVVYGHLTVQLMMSSPGAPPPPLSPDGATVGAVLFPDKTDQMQVKLENIRQAIWRQKITPSNKAEGSSHLLKKTESQFNSKSEIQTECSIDPVTAIHDFVYYEYTFKLLKRSI